MSENSKAAIAVIATTRALATTLTSLKIKIPNGLDGAKVAAHVASAQAVQDKIEALSQQLAAAVDERRAALRVLTVDAKQVRLGVKAMFGDDSAEYEKVGGTRASERKKPKAQ